MVGGTQCYCGDICPRGVCGTRANAWRALDSARQRLGLPPMLNRERDEIERRAADATMQDTLATLAHLDAAWNKALHQESAR